MSRPSSRPPVYVSKPRGNNLVALGSAAVLIIYTAGFAKTKPAADRMAAESAERRPRSTSRAGAGAAGARTGTGESGESPVAAMPASSVGNVLSATPVAPKPSAPITPMKDPRVQGASAGIATAPTLESVQAATSTVPVAKTEAALPPTANVPMTAPPAAASVEATPIPAASAPVPAAPTSSAPAAVATPASAAAPAAKTTYKDGVFLGRGTSRHGDIEAMVEIRGGRIANAVISQCLTRYSCSWIAVLVPQVVARQSAEVDYVSGATVSSDAFYYAVTQALAQAK